MSASIQERFLFFYGTAWKEEATRGHVEAALRAGFRGIDTANQRKHYHEAGVGEGLRAAFDAGVVTREELFIQTKYTFQRGQDERLPYDPRATIGEQVHQSFERSLVHLGVASLDSLVLHGPTLRKGLGPDDREAWTAMEALQRSGRVTHLGVSNVSAQQAQLFSELGNVRFVQNRCYASRGWDASVRQVCRERGIEYQGFSLLTANDFLRRNARVQAIAARHGRTFAQVVFSFARRIGILPLNGTTDPAHMKEDLEGLGFTLTPDEIREIGNAGIARR